VKRNQPGANHSILLGNLDQKGLVYSIIEEWLDVTIQEKGTALYQDSHFREEIFPARQWIRKNDENAY
jgi:hypothetical protein